MKPVHLLLAILAVLIAVGGGYFAFERSTSDTEQVAETKASETSSAAKKDDALPSNVDVAVQTPEKTEAIETAEPSSQVDAKEETTAVIAPSFDVVRVEKSGDALFAGQAAPNSMITIENKGEVIAEAKTDTSGTFVAIPTSPLTGGDNEVVIRSVDNDGRTQESKQVVAIAVNGDETPLVVVVEVGKPANIIQKPEVEVATLTKEETTIPEPQAAPAPVAEVTTPEPKVVEEPKEAEEIIVATAPEPASEVEPAPAPEPVVAESASVEAPQSAEAEVVVTAEPDVSTQEAPVQDEVKQEAASSEPVVAVEAAPETKESTETAEAPVPSPAPVAVTVPAPAQETEPAPTVIAKVEPEVIEQPEPDPVPAATIVKVRKELKVSVEAVETEDEKIFIAGSGTPEETVRIYVNEKLLGDAISDGGGRWLLEETRKLVPGTYNIRADLLQENGQVKARAEVPFVVADNRPTEIRPLDTNLGRRVIIRKNDNLWTISRRLYGDGRRFTSIYAQNREQIRNPHLIFPGQVFELPGDALAPLQGPGSPEKKG